MGLFRVVPERGGFQARGSGFLWGRARKVAVSGRSMLNVVSVAEKLGYLRVPENVLIDIELIKRFKFSILFLPAWIRVLVILYFLHAAPR